MKRFYLPNGFTICFDTTSEDIGVVITGIGNGTCVFNVSIERMSDILREDIVDCVDGIVYLENYFENNDGVTMSQLKAVSIRTYIDDMLYEESAHLIAIVLISDMLDSLMDLNKK